MNGSEHRPAISIVMPVYKVPEPFLRACVESVLSQTFGDFELLIVGDGIPEESTRKIIESYAASDARVRFIDFEQNRGVAAARNEALKLLRGAFTGFIDADDLIAPDYYEHLIVAAQSENADMVWCGGCRICGERLFQTRIPRAMTVHSGDVAGKLAQYRVLDTSVCTKLYRTSALIGAEFPEGVANGEDFGFNFQVFWRCGTSVCLAYAGYRYRIQSPDAARKQDPGVRVLRSTEVLVRFLCARFQAFTETLPSEIKGCAFHSILRLYVRYANKLWRIEDPFARAEWRAAWNLLFDEALRPLGARYPSWIGRLALSFGRGRNFNRIDILLHRLWLARVRPGRAR